MTKYKLVGDNSGHDYVIPVDRTSEWYKIVDDEYATVPEWAICIGGDLQFENPTENGRLLFTESPTPTYCCVVKRELEAPYTFHFAYSGTAKPSSAYVEKLIREDGISFNSNYETFEFWAI